MFYSPSTKTVYLNPSSADIQYNTIELNLSGVSPFLVIFHPENILSFGNYLTSKPYKIEYQFGNNLDSEIHALTPSVSSIFNFVNPNIQLPFPREPHDPRNFPVSAIYTVQNATSTIYNGEITVKWFSNIEEQSDYLTYKINVSVLPPSLTPSNYSSFGLFENIHLHSVRMFGPDDTVLYNFESKNPNYLMPTLVKWPTINASSTAVQPKDLPPNSKYEWRGYNLKAPFER